MTSPGSRDLTFAEVAEILRILDAVPRGGKVEVRLGESTLTVHLAHAPGAARTHRVAERSSAAAFVAPADESVASPAVPSIAPIPTMSSEAPAAPSLPPRDMPDGAVDETDREGLVAVIAPMTGVFYRAPAPGEPPFVDVGDEVVEGQDLALIEVMKLMNRIGAPCCGVVRSIDAENEELVEFGRAIMWIEPLAPESG